MAQYQPFNSFSILEIDPTTSNAPFDKKLVVGIAAGAYENGPGTLLGMTGCGLYSLLRLAKDSSIVSFGESISLGQNTNPNWNRIYYDTQNKYFFFPSLQDFIGKMNDIHANINKICRSYLAAPDNPFPVNAGYTMSADIYENRVSAANVIQASYAGKNAFLMATRYIAPNAYTGNTAGVLPLIGKPDGVNLQDEEPIGNGITGAFFTVDSPDGVIRLSRTGMEFYTVCTLLSYNCNVAIAGDYISLTQPSQFANQPDVDVIVSLDMGGYIDGQTSATGDNRAIYGGLIEGYSVGNSYNFCHGSSAFALTDSSFGMVRFRNNVINGVVLDDYAVLEDKLLIHAGFSGADLNINQSSTDYTTINRYTGLNGLTSQYQYQQDIAGLTAYRLSSDKLKNTFCILGKKIKSFSMKEMSNFFPGGKDQITIEIPLVADVAGAMNRAKVADTLYLSAAGYSTDGSKNVINADDIVPTFPPTNPATPYLKANRINYYSQPQSGGFYLATDFVGVTGNSPTNTNRVQINLLQIELSQKLKTFLTESPTSFVGRVNSADTRNSIRSAVISYLENSAEILPIRNSLNLDGDRAFAGSVNGIPNVLCDARNNPDETSTTVNVDVTVYPKSIQQGVFTGTNIQSITVSVSIGD